MTPGRHERGLLRRICGRPAFRLPGSLDDGHSILEQEIRRNEGNGGNAYGGRDVHELSGRMRVARRHGYGMR